MNLNDVDYLSLLQRTEKSRRPAAAAAARSEEDRLREERERGFSTHFSGANKEEKPKGRRATSVGRVSLQPPGVVRRRGWNNEAPTQPVLNIETREEYAGEAFEEDCEDSLDADSSRNDSNEAEGESSSPYQVSSQLVERVSGLDPKQQAMLLSLIDQVVAASPQSGRKKSSGQSPLKSNTLHSQRLDLEAEPVLIPPASERTPSRDMPIRDEFQLNTDIIQQAEEGPVESDSSEIRIRIRLNSVWENSGFVSLDGMELIHETTLASYDLRAFKVVVLNGLTPFPNTSEAVRHVYRLFRRQAGQTPRVRSEEPWRAPFNKSTTTVEIQASGSVPKGDAGRLRLRVFNGSSSQRVKDLDVFLGNKCVWSGRWQPTEPVLDIPLLPEKDITRPAAPESNVASSLASLPGSSALVSDVAETKDLPSWLSDLRTPKGGVLQYSENRLKNEEQVPLASSPKAFDDHASGRHNGYRSMDFEFNMVSPSKVLSASPAVPRATSSSRGSRRRQRSEGEVTALADEAAEVDRDRANYKALTSPRKKTGTPRRRRNTESSNFEETAVPSPKPEVRSALSSGMSLASSQRIEGEGAGESDAAERRRQRNRRIDNVQEVIAKLNDSLAVLLPTSPSKDITTSYEVNDEDDNDEDDAIESFRPQASDLAAPRQRGVSFASAVTVIDEVDSLPTPKSNKILTLVIYSNWGDEEFVGLNGIEIFNTNRDKLRPVKVYINDNHGDDPNSSSADVLIDGVNFTKDDHHSWSLPLSSSQRHGILCNIVFELSDDPISLILIWNYNKSRTHRIRGVKDCELVYDGDSIFKG